MTDQQKPETREEQIQSLEGDNPGEQFQDRIREINREQPNADPIGAGDKCTCGGTIVDRMERQEVGGAVMVRRCNVCGKDPLDPTAVNPIR